MQSYDVIVVGLGAIGSAALYSLGQSGASVLGIERQPASPHTQGSSHGQTRLLRVAYQEGGFYVPLVRRSIDLWRDIEHSTQTKLFHQSGILYAGPERSALLAGSRAAAAKHGVEIKIAPNCSLPSEFSGIPAEWQVLYEPEGGYLHVERAITALLTGARKAGAKTCFGKQALSFTQDGNSIHVGWNGGQAKARTVIACIGSWAPAELRFLKPYLHLERRVLHWYADDLGRFSESSNFKPFAFQPRPNNMLYGFPAIDGRGVKVANHSTLSVDPINHPGSVNRDVHPEDCSEVDRFVRRHLPDLGRRIESAVCMYTMSQDGDFIIDHHPEIPNLYFTAGLSGHGFKFTPVLGEIMAQLALTKKTQHNVVPFSLKRFN